MSSAHGMFGMLSYTVSEAELTDVVAYNTFDALAIAS